MGKEIQEDEFTRCIACGEGLAPEGLVFYRVTLEQHLVDVGALQRRQGLAMMMGGNHALARVFSPDSQFSKQVWEHKALVCQRCVLERDTRLHRFFPEGD